MTNKTKLAIVGLGWPGKEHLKGYRQCADAEVVAVCDLNTELAKLEAHKQNVPRVYSDHRKLFAEEDIDAVSVCLPNFLHAPICLDALRAGKHVLCEKPPALDARQARQMARTAERAGLTLMFALCQRFGAAARLTRDLIDRGDLGDIYYGHAVYHRRRGIPTGTRSWFVEKKRSGGGALIDIGVHALDCTWWLMGNPQPIAVSGNTYQKFQHALPKGTRFDVDDSAFALIKFANNATLFLECSWALNLPGNQSTRIAGTLGGAELSPLRIFTERDGIQLDVTPHVPDVDAFAAQTAHFLACIRSGETPITSGVQGVQLMQMIDGIYKSAATGRDVKIR